jgi:hypothetical protein
MKPGLLWTMSLPVIYMGQQKNELLIVIDGYQSLRSLQRFINKSFLLQKL